MIALLGIIGASLFLVSIVALIKPLPALKLPTRSRAGLALGCGIVIIFTAAGLEGNKKGEYRENAGTAHQAEVNPLKPKAPVIPLDQTPFVKAVLDSREAFRKAPNELAKGGTRAQRRELIKKALSSLSVKEWTGKIAKLDSNNDGKGVLEIELAEKVTVSTWNNALSDISSNTLIDPSSQLFQTLTTMTKGDQVIFSGRFFPCDVDGVDEQSLSLSGSMRAPEFVFRFASVKRSK